MMHLACVTAFPGDVLRVKLALRPDLDIRNLVLGRYFKNAAVDLVRQG